MTVWPGIARTAPTLKAMTALSRGSLRRARLRVLAVSRIDSSRSTCLPSSLDGSGSIPDRGRPIRQTIAGELACRDCRRPECPLPAKGLSLGQPHQEPEVVLSRIEGALDDVPAGTIVAIVVGSRSFLGRNVDEQVAIRFSPMEIDAPRG